MEYRNSDTFLRLPEVKNRTGFSRSSIYLYIKRGLFPAPMKLGLRSVGWLEVDIQNWIASRRKGGENA
jgi:prophage regulatory protein